MKYKSMMVFNYDQMDREAQKRVWTQSYTSQYNPWLVLSGTDDDLNNWLLENGGNAGEEVLIKIY